MILAIVLVSLLVMTLMERVQHRRKNPSSYQADADVARRFPLPGLAEELARREGIPLVEALRREREFRRWFVLDAASPVRIGLGSPAVDRVRRLLLTRRRLYARFSRAVAGRVVAAREGSTYAVHHARTFVAYERVWGETPPPDLWGVPDEAAVQAVRDGVGARGARSGTSLGGSSSSSADDGSATVISLMLLQPHSAVASQDWGSSSGSHSDGGGSSDSGSSGGGSGSDSSSSDSGSSSSDGGC